MSGGGGGIIIIKNLIDNPGTSAEEKDELRRIEGRFRRAGRCSMGDAWRVSRITYRLVRRRQ